MKIIDLLVKIANDEEVPKKIKYDDKVYELEHGEYVRYDEDGGMWTFLYDKEDMYKLTNEIEIIADKPKKIELLKIECDDRHQNHFIVNESGAKCFLTKHSKMIVEQQNEIAKSLNYLLEKSDKE